LPTRTPSAPLLGDIEALEIAKDYNRAIQTGDCRAAKDSDHGAHLVVVKFADHFVEGRMLCLLHTGGALKWQLDWVR
jgi:hypothetical protein